MIDDLSIDYDGNRLLKVTDDAEALNYNGALDFNDGDDGDCEYRYDSNGALTYDSNRGISSISYDYGHHPSSISLGTKKHITNDYSPDGRKQSSQHVAYVPKGNGANRRISIIDLYIDGLILRKGTPLLWQFDGGYVDLDENGSPTSWNYYVTDHLGSTRKVVGSDNTVRETINYYPFGSEMIMQDPAQMTGDIQHPYRFTGKELDRVNGLNTYDYGARQYNPVTARWDRVDPLAEKYYSVSPYVYCMGNPIKFIDIYGMAPGDRFKNPTLAAIDFGITYNVESIQTNKELSSYIYKMKDKNGKTYYTYPGPAKGSKANVSKEDMKSIDRSKISVDEFIDVVANIHTHGRELENYENNKFSGEQATPKQNKEWRGEKRRGNGYRLDDISEANRTQTYSYVVTPNGELRGYDPKTGKVTVWSNKMPTSEKVVNNSGKTNSNNSIWERLIRFFKFL